MTTCSAPRPQDSSLSTTAPSTAVTLSAEQFSALARQLRAPPAQLLTDEQSAAVLGVSVRRFHELRHEAYLPAAVVLGKRLLRWHRAELEAAIAKMPRQGTVAAEPSQLLRGRIERMKQGV